MIDFNSADKKTLALRLNEPQILTFISGANTPYVLPASKLINFGSNEQKRLILPHSNPVIVPYLNIRYSIHHAIKMMSKSIRDEYGRYGMLKYTHDLSLPRPIAHNIISFEKFKQSLEEKSNFRGLLQNLEKMESLLLHEIDLLLRMIYETNPEIYPDCILDKISKNDTCIQKTFKRELNVLNNYFEEYLNLEIHADILTEKGLGSSHVYKIIKQKMMDIKEKYSQSITRLRSISDRLYLTLNLCGKGIALQITHDNDFALEDLLEVRPQHLQSVNDDFSKKIYLSTVSEIGPIAQQLRVFAIHSLLQMKENCIGNNLNIDVVHAGETPTQRNLDSAINGIIYAKNRIKQIESNIKGLESKIAREKDKLNKTCPDIRPNELRCIELQKNINRFESELKHLKIDLMDAQRQPEIWMHKIRHIENRLVLSLYECQQKLIESERAKIFPILTTDTESTYTNSISGRKVSVNPL